MTHHILSTLMPLMDVMEPGWTLVSMMELVFFTREKHKKKSIKECFFPEEGRMIKGVVSALFSVLKKPFILLLSRTFVSAVSLVPSISIVSFDVGKYPLLLSAMADAYYVDSAKLKSTSAIVPKRHRNRITPHNVIVATTPEVYSDFLLQCTELKLEWSPNVWLATAIIF